MRVEYADAIYHLMSRGDRREDIFLDDVDRQDFLKTLAEACQQTAFKVHAYDPIPCQNEPNLGWPHFPNGLAAGWPWDPGRRSIGGFMNKNEQNVDMLGTDPFMI